MHVAIVISSLKPGGAERTASELANHWVNQGRKVTLITLSSSEEKPFYPLHPHIQLIPLDQTTLETASFFTRLTAVIKRIASLRKALATLKPDCVISLIDVINITALLANCGLKSPIVVSERTHPAYHRLPWFYVRLRRLTYGWACKLVVQTQSAADYFPKKRQTQIVVVPNAVKKPPRQKRPCEFLKPVKDIYSVGRLCPDKGFALLIKAFAAVIPDYADLTLTIYGEGEERASLEALIARLNLQSKIHLPGVTANIYDALNRADLFIFPSHYEGFPNALCEAMSVGIPVIASNCPGNVDVMRDGIDGRLFPVGDVKLLETRLVELLNDPMQRENFSRHALKITDRFSELDVYKLWDDVIAEALIKV